MRCKRNGLVCEYMPTEQRARSAGTKKPEGHKDYSSTSASSAPFQNPPPISTSPNLGYGQAPPYGVHGGRTAQQQSPYAAPMPPAQGSTAYYHHPSPQRAPGPYVPSYAEPPSNNNPTQIPPTMQHLLNPTHQQQQQQPVAPQYPPSYTSYGYNWNTSKQPG
ncbi:hypothetical protein C8R46DRAFT_1227139 [Mycena filopes]|nr:hypothetical protein C8R46DRAFT_1227139 [Mycena filopes]